MKQSHIIVSILTCTIIFAGLNYSNVRDVYRMTFSTPQLATHPSAVTRIRLTDGGLTYQESFIDKSILTPDQKSVFFFFVPEEVTFATSQLYVQDMKVSMQESIHNTARYEDGERVVYILRSNNHAEMISLIQSQKLTITQPPRP